MTRTQILSRGVTKKRTNGGFTLIFALLIVAAIIGVTSTMASLLIKELRISGLTEDSVKAYFAAQSGLECVYYWTLRGVPFDGTQSIECDGQNILADSEVELDGTYCATVEVDTGSTPASIVSHGFDTCDLGKQQVRRTIGNDQAELATNIVYQTPPPGTAPTCPFTSGTIANFLTNNAWRYYISGTGPTTLSQAVNVPAGTYNISVYSVDSWAGRSAQQPELNESYNVRLNLSGGGQTTIGATTDIPEGGDFGERTDTYTGVTLADAVTSITAVHAAPGTDNSVSPGCVSFELQAVPPPVGCTIDSANGWHKGVALGDPAYEDMRAQGLDCGMLLHLTFDSADWIGNSTARDTAGFSHANNANLTGTNLSSTPSPLVPGKYGQAIRLDGDNDKLVTTTLMNLNGDFTMTFWARGVDFKNGVQGLVGKPNAYKIKRTDSGVQSVVKVNSGGNLLGADVDTAVNRTDNTWHFFALRFDSSGAGPNYPFKIYVDNTTDSGFTRGNTPNPSSDHLWIGCWDIAGYTCYNGTNPAPPSPGGGGHLEGDIDDVRIYGRTLTDAEIQQLKNR